MDAEISQEVSNSFSDMLTLLVRYDKFKGTAPKDKKLVIVVNTMGGSVYHGLEICNEILKLRKIGYHVTTKTTSFVASMGSSILACGDERIVSRFADVLIHCPLMTNPAEMSETYPEIIRKGVNMKALWNRMIEVYVQCGVPLALLKSIEKSNLDRYLGAEECLKYKLATAIE